MFSFPFYSLWAWLYRVSGAGAVTEEVWLDAGAKASGSSLYTHSLHGNPANTNGDIFDFNALAACLNNTGVFSRQADVNGRFICATATDASMTGVVTPGNILKLTITDSEVNGGVGVVVTVNVAGDTASTLATKFTNAITANGTLSTKFITASTTGGSHFLISSGTGNDTLYAFSNGGGTENMILTWQGDGKDSVLSRAAESILPLKIGTLNKYQMLSSALNTLSNRLHKAAQSRLLAFRLRAQILDPMIK